MIDAVFQVTMKDNAALPDWKGTAETIGLHDRCSRLAKTRNKLAHHMILGRHGQTPPQNTLLIPPIFDPRTHAPNTGKVGLTTNDIKKIHDEFLTLSYAIGNFSSRLAGHPERFAGYPAQLTRQRTSKKPKARKRAKL